MQIVYNALLNCLLVSIPEEFIITSIVLIALNRIDLLDIHRWKRNIKLLSIPILPGIFFRPIP
jgi:hypothetical protein